MLRWYMDEPFRGIFHNITTVSQSYLTKEKIFLRNLYVFGISPGELKEGCERFQFHQAK